MISNEEKARLIAKWNLKEFGINGTYHNGNFQPKETYTTYRGKSEVYNSYFNFDERIKEHYKKNKNSVAGFREEVGADSLIIDIDCDGHLDEALKITREVIEYWDNIKNVSGYRIYFSGNKGFHLELSSSLFGIFMPADNLPLIHKEMAKKLVMDVIEKHKELEQKIGKAIFDVSIYKPTFYIRVNNTLNKKSGLFKIELTKDELFSLDIPAIKGLAKGPRDVGYKEEGSNLTLENLYQTIGMRFVGKKGNNDFSAKADGVIIRDVDFKKFGEIDTHCKWLNKVTSKDQIENDDRIALGQLLLPFGEDGVNKLKEIFSNTANYDECKTNYHLSIMSRDEYRPPLCKTICDIYPCPAMEAIGKKSPIAFSYVTKLKKYNESFIVERFLSAHPHLIYSTQEEDFFEYSGGVYSRVSTVELEGLISSFMKVHIELAAIKKSHIKNVCDRLKSEADIFYKDEFNTGRVINLQNGIYDLNTGKLGEHSPSLHHSIQLDFEYNAYAKAPKFEAFLTDIFDGDKEKIDFILKMMCYFLIKDYSYQKVFVFFGKGRNGKGVLSKIIIELLGENNVSGLPMHTLIKSNTAPYTLKDKLLNVSSELSTKDAEVGMIKSLSGNDTITSDRKFKDWVSFTNTAKLLIMSNHLPRFSELDNAILERFVMITFKKMYTEKDDNTGLFAELGSELSGILNLVVSKYPEIVVGEGISFPIPKTIKKDLSILKKEVSSVGEFIYEACKFSATAENPLQDVYDSYKKYCDESGYRALGKRNFQSTLEAFDEIELVKRNFGLVVKGVSIPNSTMRVIF